MIVVTGASGGIGSRLVPELAGLDKVVAIHNTSPPTGSIDNVVHRKVDLRSRREIEAFAADPALDDERVVLLSLAGKSQDALALNISDEQWRDAIAVNATAPLLLAQLFAPRMMRAKWGRIILVSTIVATAGAVGALPYGASKSTLAGMNRAFAAEFGRFGITSNILQLGYFQAGLGERLSPDVRSEALRRIPSRSFGSVSDIKEAVHFLIKAPYVNGSTIRIDGGL